MKILATKRIQPDQSSENSDLQNIRQHVPCFVPALPNNNRAVHKQLLNAPLQRWLISHCLSNKLGLNMTLALTILKMKTDLRESEHVNLQVKS